MTTRRTTEDINHVEKVPFQLVLPDEINVRPKWIVDMPRGKQALVYQYVSLVTKLEDVAHDVYTVHVVSKKTGRTAIGLNYYGRDEGNSFHTLIAVKHFLFNMVATLSAKKTTRKTVNVQDLTEADDDDE